MRLDFLRSCTIALVFAGILASAAHAQQASTFNLLACTNLPEKIQMHGTAVVGNRIYVIGGDTNPAGWSDRVYSADIKAGGALGTWRTERQLPKRRAYISNAVEVVNNRIYIIAGSETETADQPEGKLALKNDVLWTTVLPDGSLAEWKVSAPFPGTKATAMASATSERNIFVSGGSGGGIQSAVYSAQLSEDGSISAWQAPRALPTPLWFHGMAILENRLYVFGGLTDRANTSINDKVWSAEVEKNGGLGPWQEEMPMPRGVYQAAFSGFNDYLISVAGRYSGGEPHDNIWYASVINGRVQNWQSLKTDVKARLFHSVGLDEARGVIYIGGGQFRSGVGVKGEVLDAVQAFRIAAPPPRGAAVAAATPQKYLTLDKALAQAGSENKKVLAVFHSPEVPAAKRLWSEVIQTPGFATLAKNLMIAEVDVSTVGASTTYKYSIFKVPALAVLRADGGVVGKTTSVKTLSDVQQFLSQLPQ